MIMMIVSVPVDAAENIAKKLLSKRIAGCVQILKSVESIYIWKGKLETADESILFVKLPKKNKSAAQEIIKEVHPYEVPEILSVDVSSNEDYRRWLYAAASDKWPKKI